MIKRLLFLLKIFIVYILVFVFAKVVFILVGQYKDISTGEFTGVLWHGLSLDTTISLYLIILPLLIIIMSTWWNRWSWLYNCLKGYLEVSSIPIVLAIVSDIVLYHFWGIKLDASVMQFVDTTGAAFTSVSWTMLLIMISIIVCCCYAISKLLIRCIPKDLPKLSISKRIAISCLIILLIPFIIIGIRGGVSESTANVGQVYFSKKQFLNHAAVNPVFSFISSYSSTHQPPNHHFYDTETCHEITDSLFFTDSNNITDTLLTNKSPNILMVIMEGCGGTFTLLNDNANVTPTLTKLAHEGIFFSNCYANSWRTDRGNVSILSGYPAFPNSSVMKMAQKCASMPSLARTLSEKDYYVRYIYGGDINFTNTKGYLMSTGFNETISNSDFTKAEQKSSSWGVCDEIVFNRVISIMNEDNKAKRKGLNVVMTLSSHEPWDVPMQKVFDDEILNAFHYLDKCIGLLVEQLKTNHLWENTLLIILPDHGTRYKELSYGSKTTCHIPLIWTGGAISKHKDIQTLCNQSDIAATLLGQMGIDHSDFTFSRDILSSSYRNHFACYSYTNHIALIDSMLQFHLYDLQENDTEEDGYYKLSKALLQRACEDLRNR